MKRFNPVFAPDGMTSINFTTDRFDYASDRFDDGLVHNHHWAVSTDEAYPSRHQGQPIDDASPYQVHDHDPYTSDRHDDGLVHNHGWAITEQ
jgi:hypothetical protein